MFNRNSSKLVSQLLVVGLLLQLMACSTVKESKTGSSANSVNSVDKSSSEYDNSGDLEKFRINQQNLPKEQQTSQDSEELETIPVEVNENVEMWIKYFQGRGREHMEKYLARSTRYEALMKKVLRDNKLPEDLFYIALIESGFSPRAFSNASAVGYWQFIRGTGKRYKLKIDKMIDERRDPVIATQAAAEYFKDLYTIFNSWYLSMAAYNVGEGRVIKVVKKYQTRDFWELSRHKRALPKETDNYVPKYIAAKLIAKNPDKYGFEGIDYMTPIEFDHFTFNQPINLRAMAEKLNVNYEDFKDLNPKYKGEVAPVIDGSVSLRIPVGTFEVAQQAAQASVADIADYKPDEQDTQNYKVRRGDSLGLIARRYRTSVAYLREINDFSRKKRVKVGMVIQVPDRTPLVERPRKQTSKKKKEKNINTINNDFYVVRRGDSLASIAAKFNVAVAEISRANNMSRKSRLRTGARIMIPR